MVFNTGSLAVSTDFQQVVFSRLCWQFFNRFSTGCQTGFQLVAIAWQWSFHVAMAIVAMIKEEESGREQSSRSQGVILGNLQEDTLGNRLCTHGCGLGLSPRGADGGIEEERHVEHFALQQQTSSLLHLRKLD